MLKSLQENEVIIIINIIKPQSSSKENKYVALFILFICLVTFFLLKLTVNNDDNNNKLSNNEIYSSSLKPHESNIYSQLNIVAGDYDFLYEQYKDVSIETLSKLYYPPFVKDASWEISGRHNWSMLEHDNTVYYIGISSDKNVSGDFVLEINKKNFESKIWYNNTVNIKSINQNKLDKFLANCKIIISYTGKNYIEDAK